ncbi:lecithin:cholesterol acyltransferase [Plasmodium yoelii]|uniref:Phospholipase n=3 Tax=Plasmodium yoelii TaxID=5861 RepID=A0AAE9WYG2_PLAYO|nr:lecithin:cholesterol acyltransferase [Plasmodium yoelii]EAA15989.1 Lecithin:cholesterol acyltransferase, putative [Plasmodium yoelii yoelii]WBY58703.1 phospholipase [Plasmodium yoelii yoelii]CDU18983.1 phosphatidylcholine-sterol acyltransferase, putative [Plasmodium yoelii]VTZ79568.1 phosphatidylcholine-sterol acyltransferase, putative [Plasmodium yoelii]|eukprot:XP_724424.1 lecithin:cholesterol acyltransferase [Plasmodium yoelii]
MQVFLFIIILYNCICLTLIYSFNPSIGSIINVLIKTPYKLSFGESNKNSEIANLEGTGNFLNETNTEETEQTVEFESKESKNDDQNVLNIESTPEAVVEYEVADTKEAIVEEASIDKETVIEETADKDDPSVEIKRVKEVTAEEIEKVKESAEKEIKKIKETAAEEVEKIKETVAEEIEIAKEIIAGAVLEQKQKEKEYVSEHTEENEEKKIESEYTEENEEKEIESKYTEENEEKKNESEYTEENEEDTVKEIEVSKNVNIENETIMEEIDNSDVEKLSETEKELKTNEMIQEKYGEFKRAEDSYYWESKSTDVEDGVDDDVDDDEIVGLPKKSNNTIIDNTPKSSVYLVPGLGGSTLIAEYNHAQIDSCSSKALHSKPYRIWLSLSRLFSIRSNVYCLFDTLKLDYDRKKKMYRNKPGVFINVEHYGYIKGVAFLDYIKNKPLRLTRYYGILADKFLENGYIDGKDILSAPYDWRFPLSQQKYEVLKSHIEYIYGLKKGTKVDLIGHSLGGLFINYFLSQFVDEEWKKKYINIVMHINVPFAGSIKAIRALLYSSKDYTLFKLRNILKVSISGSLMKAISHNMGSPFDLIPYRKYYDRDQIVVIINMGKLPIDEKLVQSIVTECGIYNERCYTDREDVNLKTYTLSNWHELLSDDIREKYENYIQYTDRFFSVDHGIPTYCLYSTTRKRNTEYMLFYQDVHFNHDPIIYYGIGDGTISLESLEACKKLQNVKEAKHFVYYKHIGILKSDIVSDYIYNIINQNRTN